MEGRSYSGCGAETLIVVTFLLQSMGSGPRELPVVAAGGLRSLSSRALTAEEEVEDEPPLVSLSLSPLPGWWWVGIYDLSAHGTAALGSGDMGPHVSCPSAIAYRSPAAVGGGPSLEGLDPGGWAWACLHWLPPWCRHPPVTWQWSISSASLRNLVFEQVGDGRDQR